MKVLKNYSPVLTQKFGVKGHLGLDIVGKGTTYNVLDTIVAVAKGKVELVVSNIKGFVGGGSYGNQVVINHGNGYKTRYAHLDSVKVKVGQAVIENQELGFMGNTGTSYGGHLHFEIIHNGKVINPYDYIFKGKSFMEIVLPTTHKVVSGDTVAKICLKYYGVADRKHFDFIKKVNNLNDKYLITIGQVLNIPIYKEEAKPIKKEDSPKNDIDTPNTNESSIPNDNPIDTETSPQEPKNEEIKASTSVWVLIFKFIIKFIKEMFNK